MMALFVVPPVQLILQVSSLEDSQLEHLTAESDAALLS